MVAAGRGAAFLKITLAAFFRVESAARAAVLPNNALPAVDDHRRDVRQALGLLPEHMRLGRVSISARLEREGTVFPLGHELDDRVPLVAGDLAILVGVHAVEEVLEVLAGLVA